MPTYRYSLIVPLCYNDGEQISLSVINVIEDHVAHLAGGFTRTDGTGAWRGPYAGDGTYREPVRVYAFDVTPRSKYEAAQILIDARWVAAYVRDVCKQKCVYLTRHELDTWEV